jgi:hypothetical protein
VVLAGLILGAVFAFRGPVASGNAKPSPAALAAASKASGLVYFRPVLCFAPPYNLGAAASAAPAGISCATNRLSAENLDVQPYAHGYSVKSIPPDPDLAALPSTKPTGDKPSSVVLVPGLPAGGPWLRGERYVLGPAEVSSASIASAVAKPVRAGRQNRVMYWVVDYRLTPDGSALWDKSAFESFHQMIAVDLNGFVYSAPLIQPTQNHFSSFRGHGEVGGLTKADAIRLAKAMQSHATS